MKKLFARIAKRGGRVGGRNVFPVIRGIEKGNTEIPLKKGQLRGKKEKPGVGSFMEKEEKKKVILATEEEKKNLQGENDETQLLVRKGILSYSGGERGES